MRMDGGMKDIFQGVLELPEGCLKIEREYRAHPNESITAHYSAAVALNLIGAANKPLRAKSRGQSAETSQ